jgi:hypothetical protein
MGMGMDKGKGKEMNYARALINLMDLKNAVKVPRFTTLNPV